MLTAALASADDDHGRGTLIVTSTNDANANSVVVFRLNTDGTPSLSFVTTMPAGGSGGASGNAGAVQFSGGMGAVVNWGSNNVTQLVRVGDSVQIGKTIALARNCVGPDSVALSGNQMFVVGTNCAESHRWPSGDVDGMVSLSDASAAQIAAGQTWAAVTMKSGFVVQLPLAGDGALNGTSNTITLPANANNTPLGEAFWGDLLALNPAHSADSFALIDRNRNVTPVLGPQPAFPTNAPCWLVKGPGNIWYSGNSPGDSISIFFSDGQSGVFYKSVALPGSPSDITVSPDGKWLAVIYTDNSGGHVAVFAIDAYGDLSPVATSNSIGATAFNGVAFSQ